MTDSEEIMKLLREIRADQIANEEYRTLGHRIVYDIDTGKSINVLGGVVDTAKLDRETGFRIR